MLSIIHTIGDGKSILQVEKFFNRDSAPEGTEDKLKSELARLDGDCAGHKFLLSDEITIADIFVYNDLLNVTELIGFELEGDNIRAFMDNMKGTGSNSDFTVLSRLYEVVPVTY